MHKVILWSIYNLQNVNNIMALNYLESEVGFKRGKGGKFQNCIVIKNEIPDDKVDDVLKNQSNADDCPKLIVIMNSGSVVLVSAVGDARVISIKETEIIHGLMVLIGLYYICGLSFPRPYGQFLGIMQEIGMKEQYKGSKSQGFMQWMSILRNNS